MPAYAIDGVVPVVDPTAFVHPTAIRIGDVVIAAGCYVGPGASLRGDMGRIRVAAGANVQDGCVLHCFPGRETSSPVRGLARREVEPLQEPPAIQGTLAISQERARPLREFRRGAETAPGHDHPCT